MKTQSVAIVLHDLRGGGAEKMMVRLANALAEQNTAVTMVLLTEGGVNKAELSSAVKLVELGSPRTLSSVPRLAAYLREAQPDRILSALTHVNVAAALACAMTGMLRRLVVSERNTYSLDKKVNTGAVMKFTYWLAPKIYRRLPNPIIAVSGGVARDLIETESLRPKDIVVAPNPVLTAKVLTMMDEPASHPWLQDPAIRVVVAVGRLSHQKGFDTLIRAFAQVADIANLKLVIFGEGELREELSALVSQLQLTEKVDLPGYAANPLAEMKAADLFVLSSRFEGSPNVLVEAMATGVPVLATNCPSGPDEILDQGRLAPLVPVDDVNAMAQALRKCMEHPSDNAELKNRADRYRDALSAQAYSAVLNGSVTVWGR
ncbi:glycosyltransferase [Hahella sp. CR1]|uniref:glycosyltransferase n=1 Tax=Hahella sp. CR1 TaxID=2992807 RepID=UPI00244204C8|nr:glycosyltransferase [Hahella sp. CR1]MDG9667600.1 glycosyltransferase [Hahella sp. CR1]